ncbi:sugar phosphate nucleotidyltransferase [Candidatus Microthrix parvicella]|jgi:mannose-1-phosphate guanylyltransferase|uniref:sugar phosphate nucleotidyltransferase n=1 Tax=Candidatus Neomicrothrix parvicella TaxID=41950 RepID=UPI0009DAC8C8|nr:sugar phosphate nucleotidyltransferase [Candidatus Microthrix parvicella]
MSVHAVVLAGGSGTRLWPVSSDAHPKQLQALFSDKPLLQQAVTRCSLFAPLDRTWVVADVCVAPQIATVLPGFGLERIIVEPERKGTLGAVALAAAHVATLDPEAVLVFLPSDHLCDQPSVLADALAKLARHLPPGAVGIVGTPVERINPQLGHFHMERSDSENLIGEPATVDRYIEKPSRAEGLTPGDWFANMGVVVVSAATVGSLAGTAASAARALIEGETSARAQWDGLPERRFEDVVLPVADRLVGIQVPVTWVDVGTWGTLSDAARGGDLFSGPVTAASTERCVAVSTDLRIDLIGVEDLIVIAAEGRVIVCHRDRINELDALRARSGLEVQEELHNDVR